MIKISNIRKYEPLWGQWFVDSLIGEGSFGRVYKVCREESGRTIYAAAKILSIPYDEFETQRMRDSGLDGAELSVFTQSLVETLIREIDLLNDAGADAPFVSYKNIEVHNNENGVSWDILLLMDLLPSLSSLVKDLPLSPALVVKLGVDICQALELCARNNTIYLNLKPENIFISPSGSFLLGDIGIAKPLELETSGLSLRGTYTTMAPEVFKGEPFDTGADTYALGMLMYTLLNMNRAPFLPEYPESLAPNHFDQALQRRITGEPVPALKNISPQLNAFLLKACAYDRQERFTGPAAMRRTLEAIAANAGYELETLVIPLIKRDAQSRRESQAMPVPRPADPTAYIRTPPADKPSPQTQETALIPSKVELIPVSPETIPVETPHQTHPILQKIRKRSSHFISNKRIPLVAALSAVFLVLIVAAVIYFSANPLLFARNITIYGISIDNQTEFVLADRAEAQAVLDELAEHYINLADAVNQTNTVSSVTYEEKVEIVTATAKPQEITLQNKQEALQDLINGKPRAIEYTVTPEETVQAIAQKFNITAQAIVAENPGITEESPVPEGTLLRLPVAQPYLHVILEGQYVTAEEIDFETEKKKDDNVILNTTELHQEGEKGSKDVTHAYVARNGVVIKETVLAETVTKEPVKEIILEGTKPLIVTLNRKGITNEMLAQMVRSGEIPKNVTHLYLSSNIISDISPLKSLTGLAELHLDGNSISDLTPLQSLTELTKLWLHKNRINNITPLKPLTKLTELQLYSNQISDISSLQPLTRLTLLDLQNNQISNVSPLSSLTKLEYLYLNLNNIADFSPLKSLKNLKELSVIGNPGASQKDELFLLHN